MSFISAAGADTTPEARVRSFIADYFKLHAASEQTRADGDFTRWSAAVERLEAAHFVAGARSGLAGVMTGNPTHSPAGEEVISNEPLDGGVLIETRFAEGGLPHYFEYELRKTGTDWRIASLRDYLDARDAPFMSDAERAQFQDPKPLPSRPMPAREAALDGAALFMNGRVAKVGDQSGAIEVRALGTLEAATGILVVGDLGYDAMTLAPLAQRVTPGRYPVDVSIAFKRVAALRVKLSNEPVAAWRPADMGDGGHVVGVDAANVAICDVSALMHITARQKEKQFEKFAALDDVASATMLSLARTHDTVIASSGYGDGAYPVYWGVDASGNPAVLLVDMLVLSELGEGD